MKFEFQRGWMAGSDPGEPGDWHWHLRARNGEIVAQGEGYTARASMVKTLRRVFGACPDRGPELEAAISERAPAKRGK